jgi:hypothetical protein
LAAALTKISEGEIGRQVALASTTALNNNTVQRGRVLLAIVFRYYAVENSAHVLYDLSRLQKLTLRGDNLESLQNTWTMVLSELSKPLDPDLLQALYVRHLQYFKPLAEDIAHYRRARHLLSGDYSHEYLWDAATRCLHMKWDDHTHESLSRGLTGSTDKAAPGVAKPKGKGANTGQGKR